MAKFKKKPIVIEAFQLTYEMAKGQNPCPIWFSNATKNGVVKVFFTDGINDSQFCEIKTLEGKMTANTYDYIIQGVCGEIYPCKSEIFELMYEKVED